MFGEETPSYSPDQAHEEANQISQIVGDQGSFHDYAAAHEMVVEGNAKAEFEHLDWFGTVEKGSNNLLSLYGAAGEMFGRERELSGLKMVREDYEKIIESCRDGLKEVEREAVKVTGDVTKEFRPSDKVWFTDDMLEGVFWDAKHLSEVLGNTISREDVARLGERVHEAIFEALGGDGLGTVKLSGPELEVYRAGLAVAKQRLEKGIDVKGARVREVEPKIMVGESLVHAAVQKYEEEIIKYKVALEALTQKERSLGAPSTSKPATAEEVKALISWRQEQWRQQEERDPSLRMRPWPRLEHYDKWAMFWTPNRGEPVLLNAGDIGNYVYAKDVLLATALPGRVVALYSEGLYSSARVSPQGIFVDGRPQFLSLKEMEAEVRSLEESGQDIRMQKSLRG